jgi:glycosyltransferase involved in cell wall biosynthesis
VDVEVNPLRNSGNHGWRLLRRLTYPLARFVVVLNERNAAYFGFLSRGMVRVIPNPVLPPSRPGFAARDKVILGMSRLSPVKRLDLVIKAFHSVSDRLPGWTVVLYGEGPHRRVLEDLIAGLGLQKRVFLPGTTQDPDSVMQRSSIFVLSSDYEGFPNAMCEAMACGMAVVAVDCETGPREILTHGVDGLLVPHGDVNALADALVALANDQRRREFLGERAALISERFSGESVRKLWKDLLDESAGP